jgi:hypothetical protein
MGQHTDTRLTHALVFRGGYARITRDDATGILCKRLDKFAAAVEPRMLNYSTVVDAAFASCLRPLQSTPIVNDIQHGSRYLDIYMKDHGPTLTAWMRRTDAGERATHAPGILRALWAVLMQLQCNGCMHTDIKPCNVLVDFEARPAAAPRVTLIDFNCMTVVDSTAVGLKYATSVGTWSHAAPELIFHEQPYPKSPVWSLALIAVALFDRYPIPARLTHDAAGHWLGDRKSWRRAIHQLMEEHTKGVPLPATLEAVMGKPLFDCVCASLRWRPEDRPALAAWQAALGAQSPIWHVLDRNVDPTSVPPEARARAIDQLYRLSFERARPAWFCNSVVLFDACGAWAASRRNTIGLVAAACWCLTGFMHNDYVVDDDATVALLAEVCAMAVSRDLPFWAYAVADRLNYNLWTKPVDVRLHERVGTPLRPPLEWLRSRWLKVDRPYTLHILADRWARALKQDGVAGT